MYFQTPHVSRVGGQTGYDSQNTENVGSRRSAKSSSSWQKDGQVPARRCRGVRGRGSDMKPKHSDAQTALRSSDGPEDGLPDETSPKSRNAQSADIPEQPARVTKGELWRIIRAKCVDCCGGVTRGADGPAGCNSMDCPLWPLRLGKRGLKQTGGPHDER